MKIWKSIAFIFLLIVVPFVVLAKSAIKTESLTCEYLKNPIGIAIPDPRLSWTLVPQGRQGFHLSQSAYEIIVSDNVKDIDKARGNVWKTGKVQSDQSLHIVYEGKPLKSFMKYYWRVKVYDQNGEGVGWSETQLFETGLLKQSDWVGHWIGDGKKQFVNEADFYGDDPMPLFRKEFEVTKPVASARLYIAGLGYYEAYLNGEKVGDHVLDPGWTAYRKEVLYTVYDIESLIDRGQNAIGVMLGNGWYNPLPLKMWGSRDLRDRITHGRPILNGMIRIEYRDGTVSIIPTDDGWKTTSGPVIRNNIYLGEHYDARAEIPDWNIAGIDVADWKSSSLAAGPEGKMVMQLQPAIKTTRVVKPVAIREVRPGIFVADMGQNFAGVVRLKVRGMAGTRVMLRYGEDIYEDGNVNFMTAVAGQVKHGNGGLGAPEVALQEDSYILKGGGQEVWAPRFTFHGFRYVEIQGWPGKPTVDDIEGLRMNADVKEVGHFESSNSMFNQLESNIQWTFLSNLFSVQSDCPAREKYGYGGDMFCTIESFMYRYDMAAFYTKALRDFVNDQRPLGGITETLPHVGIADNSPGDGSGPLGFQIGYPYLVRKLYDFYGDELLVAQHYASVQKQLEFLESVSENYLSESDLGDHESLNERSIPFTASVFYYLHAKLMKDFADILQKESDSQRYGELMENIRRAIQTRYYSREDGVYAEGTQTTQVFALWSGILEREESDKVIARLMEAFEEKDWHVSTGIFGTKMLFDVLRNSDTPEVAYTVADQRDFPGWGHMIANNATTLWETWAESDNVYSKNHPMFGSVGEWFYRSLLGINGTSPGFKTFRIQVQPGGLTEAKGSFRSVYGNIRSAWRIEGQTFLQEVEVPVNCVAEVWLPPNYSSDIRLNGEVLAKAQNMLSHRETEGGVVLELGSGVYHITASK